MRMTGIIKVALIISGPAAFFASFNVFAKTAKSSAASS